MILNYIENLRKQEYHFVPFALITMPAYVAVEENIW